MPFFSPTRSLYTPLDSHPTMYHLCIQGSLGKTGMVDAKKEEEKSFMVFREDFLVKLFGQTRQAGRGVVSAWVCVQTTSGLFNSFNLVLLWMFQFCYAYCNKCTHKISSFSPSLSSQTNYV